jgi:hypothetical protein
MRVRLFLLGLVAALTLGALSYAQGIPVGSHQTLLLQATPSTSASTSQAAMTVAQTSTAATSPAAAEDPAPAATPATTPAPTPATPACAQVVRISFQPASGGGRKAHDREEERKQLRMVKTVKTVCTVPDEAKEDSAADPDPDPGDNLNGNNDHQHGQGAD